MSSMALKELTLELADTKPQVPGFNVLVTSSWIYSAFPDVARPFMTAGFGKTFNVAFKSYAANTALWGEALQQVRWMTPIMETQMGSARMRFQEAGGQVQSFGKGKLNHIHDKIATGFNKAQGPFYFLNLLTFNKLTMEDGHP